MSRSRWVDMCADAEKELSISRVASHQHPVSVIGNGLKPEELV